MSEATGYAGGFMNRTATQSISDVESPDEKYHGKLKSLVLRSLLQPGYYIQKRSHKDQTKGEPCVCLSPAPLNSHGTSRVLVVGTNMFGTTRDVMWTAPREIHGTITYQVTPRSGPPCGRVDRTFLPVTTGSDGDNNTDTRSDDTDDEDSEPTEPIAKIVSLRNDLVPDVKGNVL